MKGHLPPEIAGRIQVVVAGEPVVDRRQPYGIPYKTVLKEQDANRRRRVKASKDSASPEDGRKDEGTAKKDADVTLIKCAVEGDPGDYHDNSGGTELGWPRSQDHNPGAWYHFNGRLYTVPHSPCTDADTEDNGTSSRCLTESECSASEADEWVASDDDVVTDSDNDRPSFSHACPPGTPNGTEAAGEIKARKRPGTRKSTTKDAPDPMSTVRRVVPHKNRTSARTRDFITMYADTGVDNLSESALRAAMLKGERLSLVDVDVGETAEDPVEEEDGEGPMEQVTTHLLGDEWAWLEDVDTATEVGKSPPGPRQSKNGIGQTHTAIAGPVMSATGAGASKPVVNPSKPLPIPPVALSEPSRNIVASRDQVQARPSHPGSAMDHAAFCSPGRAPFSSPRSVPISSPPSQGPANYTPVRRVEASPARESGASASHGGGKGDEERDVRGATPETRRVAELEEEMRELKQMVAQMRGTRGTHQMEADKEPASTSAEYVTPKKEPTSGKSVPLPTVSHPLTPPGMPADTAPHKTEVKPSYRGAAGGRTKTPGASDEALEVPLPANPLLYDPLADSPAEASDHNVATRGLTKEPHDRPLKRMLFNNPLTPSLRTGVPPRQEGAAGGASRGLGAHGECAGDPRVSAHGGPAVGALVRSGGKRDRGDDTAVYIVVDYDPDTRVAGLPRGMPSDEHIHEYAKHAWELMVRHTRAKAVTYFPKNGVRNKALRLSLRRHYDVVAIDIRVAMGKTKYSGKVGKVFSKFWNESSTEARHVILTALEIDAGGPYKQEIHPVKKASLWRSYGPRMHAGFLISFWSHAERDRRPFTNALFMNACLAAYPEWERGTCLVLVPYHIAWVMMS
ncbi:unnamed protein product, partial [Closterium sp. Naga37s-1]